MGFDHRIQQQLSNYALQRPRTPQNRSKGSADTYGSIKFEYYY